MSLISSLLAAPKLRATEPGSYTLDEYMSWLVAAGFPLVNQTWSSHEEKVEGDFAGLVRGAYQSNGVVFACLMTRFLLFSEARFQFQQLRGGRPGDLFGTPELQIIERPEPGKTTGDLLAEAMLDADLSGDWFGVRRPGRIKRLRPDWTTILIGSPNRDTTYPASDPDAEIAGYSFATHGTQGPGETWSFERSEVAHFAPIPDPLMRYRGMPLPTAVLREIRGDSAATTHKLKFFEHAATPNMIVKFPQGYDKTKAKEAIDVFEQEHKGAFNAYRTMYLLGGADATVVGKDLQQLDFKATQGAGETRIASAMNVHPVVVGLSEGLQGSALNAGNFAAARRLQADKMLRPNWRNFAGSLEAIIPPLSGTRLWYDDRDIPFLAEDVKDAVDALFVQAQAMRQLGDGGWDHDAVVDAVTSGDLRRLAGQHSGLVPVQLQSPGSSSAEGFAARADFWPSSGDWVSAQITRGDHFAVDHPIISAFPSLFEPIAHLNGHVVHQRPAIVSRTRPLELAAPVVAEAAALPQSIVIQMPEVQATQPSVVRFEAGAIQVNVEPAQTYIAKGAVQLDAPVTVEAPPPAEIHVDAQTHIAAGAFRSGDVHVEPAQTHIAKGAVQVDIQPTELHVEPGAITVPVTVEPAQTYIAKGAVHVEAPVTIQPAEIHVEPAQTHIAAGAFVGGDVTVEAPPPAEIHVDAQTHIAEGAVQVAAPRVDIHPAPPASPRAVRRTKTFTTGASGAVVGSVETEEEIVDG